MVTMAVVRPEYAAHGVPCARCGTADAYAPGICPAGAGGHASVFDLQAGRR